MRAGLRASAPGALPLHTGVLPLCILFLESSGSGFVLCLTCLPHNKMFQLLPLQSAAYKHVHKAPKFRRKAE